jgi:2-dehydropantoate 2-reductase
LLALIEEIAAVAMTTGAVVDADTAVQFFDSVPATIQSSMQHDAAAGQAIEIEAIGGAILRAGVLSGVATPVALTPLRGHLVREDVHHGTHTSGVHS